MPVGVYSKYRSQFFVALLCLLLYRFYLKSILSKKRMSTSNSSASPSSVTSEWLKSATLRLYHESKDYCIDFAKRRPIMATLLAIEMGSWAYIATKNFAKSFIWRNTVLELEIKGDYTMKPKDPLEEILNPESKNRLSFLDLIHTIRGAGKDKRIVALFIRLEQELVIGVAQCEELRTALLTFKEKYNKPIIVYADNISSWGTNAVRHYYIASVASKLYMSDDGILHLGPATVDYPFLNSGLKEKLDISVEVRRRAQYKSAGNMFARDEFDEFHKEQYKQLIEHLEKNFVDTIACSRRLKPYSIPKNVQTIQCMQWIAKRIVAENEHLEFKLDDKTSSKEKAEKLLRNIREEKSDELDENYSGSGNKYQDEWNEWMAYLVHCWSWNRGNYKAPILFVVLQFYDKNKKENVFYQATVAYNKRRLGKLQRGADNTYISEAKTDENGNELSKELRYTLLCDFKPPEPCMELVKPGDIDLPKEDRQLDEDHGRGEIRDSLSDQHIVIRCNVNDMVHHGAYTSPEAEILGLIDGRASYSDMYRKIIPELLKLDEKKISYLYVHRYYQRIYHSKLNKGIPDIVNPAEDASRFNIMKYFGKQSTKIAYISATNGSIIDGDSSKDRIGSTTLCRQLRAARKNKAIKGVILHLDTPGGSATACHNMCCEIKELVDAEKPVIAVQSNVAASGGYYLSAPCTYVLSSPSTITGSIGVIGLKFTTKKFWKNKLGINYDRVSTNPLAASYFSQLDGFGEFERIRIEQAITNWYKRFKGVIADSNARDMEMEQLETVAKGQVWLGSQALEIGLVDDLGGLYDAMTKMKELLNIPTYKKIKLVNPLGKMTIWDILLGSTPENENDFSVPRTSMAVFESVVSAMAHFVNPVNWLKYSGCANLMVSGILASPMVSSVMWMSYGMKNGAVAQGMGHSAVEQQVQMMGIMNFGAKNRIVNDVRYMADELKFYQNNSVLMYSSPAWYFNHNILSNGQL
mmetsp:Transcript_38206/g.61164  ORF Transcript_38206/g.61164 Transcript_38206/m.61164 type:complete len:978 (+) Transcript_38206:17-2950(+)